MPETVLPGQEPRTKKLRISHYTRPENTNSVLKSDSSEHSASDKTQFLSAASCRRSPYSPVQLNGHRNGLGELSQKSPVTISYDSSPSQKSSTPTRGEDLLLSSSLSQRNGSNSSEDGEKDIRNPTFGLSQLSSAYTNHEKSSQKEPLVSSKNGTDDWRHTNGYQKTCENSDSVEKPQNKIVSQTLSVNSISPKQVSPDSNSQSSGKESNKTLTNGYVNSNSIKSNYNSHTFLNTSKVTSTTNGSCSNSPHSSSDSRDSIEYSGKYILSNIYFEKQMHLHFFRCCF